MSIKNLTEDKNSFLVESRKEVVLENKGEKLTFYANEISFLDNQNIGVQSANGKNLLTLLIAASITDKDGNKFTYDEASRLKEEFAKPFLEAAAEVNRKDPAEKK